MKKKLVLLMCITFLMAGCSPPSESSIENNSLATALVRQNLSDMRSAMEEGANLDDVVINGQHINPILSLLRNHGKLIFVEELLKQGANVNAADKQGTTLLMYTSGAHFQEYYFSSGNPNYSTEAFFRLLISYGADVSLRDRNGLSALDYAVQIREAKETVRRLLAKGAPVTAKTLKLALEQSPYADSRYDIIRLVVEACDEQGVAIDLHPMVKASILGQSQEVLSLLSEGVTATEEEKNWTLFNAVAFCDCETVKELLSHGYGKKKVFSDKENYSILDVAATHGDGDKMNFVLHLGGWSQEEKDDALQHGAAWNNTPAVAALLKAGATFTRQGDHWYVSYNILDDPVCAGNLDMIQLFLDYGYPVNDITAWYAMKRAATYGQIEVLKYFMSLGYSPTYNEHNPNSESSGVLLDACLATQVETVRYLLEIGCDPNPEWECLSSAVETGNIEIVKLLLNYGADVSENKRAIELAERYGYEKRFVKGNLVSHIPFMFI